MQEENKITPLKERIEGVIPRSNIILNPLFKEFGKVQIVEFIELPIDDRLKKEKH